MCRSGFRWFFFLLQCCERAYYFSLSRSRRVQAIALTGNNTLSLKMCIITLQATAKLAWRRKQHYIMQSIIFIGKNDLSRASCSYVDIFVPLNHTNFLDSFSRIAPSMLCVFALQISKTLLHGPLERNFFSYDFFRPLFMCFWLENVANENEENVRFIIKQFERLSSEKNCQLLFYWR